MRLMLGKNNEPWVLVDVAANFDPNEFDFEVLNGRWEGRFHKGCITVLGAPSGDVTWLTDKEIICDNQDRLRGDMDDVFEHFDDENYVAPVSKYNPVDFEDDDIPF